MIERTSFSEAAQTLLDVNDIESGQAPTVIDYRVESTYSSDLPSVLLSSLSRTLMRHPHMNLRGDICDASETNILFDSHYQIQEKLTEVVESAVLCFFKNDSASQPLSFDHLLTIFLSAYTNEIAGFSKNVLNTLLLKKPEGVTYQLSAELLTKMISLWGKQARDKKANNTISHSGADEILSLLVENNIRMPDNIYQEIIRSDFMKAIIKSDYEERLTSRFNGSVTGILLLSIIMTLSAFTTYDTLVHFGKKHAQSDITAFLYDSVAIALSLASILNTCFDAATQSTARILFNLVASLFLITFTALKINMSYFSDLENLFSLTGMYLASACVHKSYLKRTPEENMVSQLITVIQTLVKNSCLPKEQDNALARSYFVNQPIDSTREPVPTGEVKQCTIPKHLLKTFELASQQQQPSNCLHKFLATFETCFNVSESKQFCIASIGLNC